MWALGHGQQPQGGLRFLVRIGGPSPTTKASGPHLPCTPVPGDCCAFGDSPVLCFTANTEHTQHCTNENQAAALFTAMSSHILLLDALRRQVITPAQHTTTHNFLR